MDIFQNNTVRVGLALIVALMIIIYFNPPHTPCQSQVDIYHDAVQGMGKTFAKSMKMCKEHTDPGGCLPFVEVLGKLEAKYNEVGHQCQATLQKDSLTRSWITSSMEILVKAAWGSQPPSNNASKNGFLELTHVVEFCRLRSHLEGIFGKEAWEDFVNNILTDLPGADRLGRNETWNKSIVSNPCQYGL